MNPKCFLTSASFCGILALTASSLHSQVTIDGNAASGENYVTLGATQTQVSNAGGNTNVLASMRCVAETNTLNLGICGRADNHAIILFIDAKPGGVTRITPDLIDFQAGGEHEFINKLAQDGDVGLTFETGFEPELAIRIFGDEVSTVKHAYVNGFDLVAHTHTYLGDSHAAIISNGPIRELKSDWENVGSNPDPLNTSAYATHRKGVEMNLNLTALGVTGTGQTIKLCAILVSAMLQDDPESDTYIEGSNQGLAPYETTDNSTFSQINGFNLQNEPGTQTLSVIVDGLDPLEDEDEDGLLNGVETNSGVFVDAENTGSNPTEPDSDGDGYPDGAEVTGSAMLGLGFISDPNIPNYTNLAVPGSFNLPSPWNFNTATNNPGTAMVRESTTLTGQYRWNLDYFFSSAQLGGFAYKFNSGYSTAIQWGASSTSGIAVATTGNDIPATTTASGFHRFSFDQKTLAYSFGRTVFENSAAFLAKYGLTAGIDSDGDGILNEHEFAANTDPTNDDSDGDGFNDREDGSPLAAAVTSGGYQQWAATIAGDSAPSADPDGDHFSNFEEYLFGTPPNNPTPTLTPVERSGGNLVIRWHQLNASAIYQVQESSTLAENPWPPATSAIVVTDPDQSDLPEGYIRKKATLPVNQARKFLRISGTD
jgi:hypothetical protein